MLKRENIIRYQHEIILFFILVFAVAVWSYEITLPYFKPWESGYQDLIARNYVNYGFFETNFLNVISVINNNFVYRFGHPPLLQILIAMNFKLFGIHEWSARIVPIVFSVLSLIILYKLVKETFDKDIAIHSTFFLAFAPMSAYFGRNVCFEALVLFFGLFLIYNYKLLLNGRNEKMSYTFLILTTILGTLTDWPFAILLFLLLIHSMTIGKCRAKIGFLFFLGTSIIGIFLLINKSITGYVELFNRIGVSSQPTVYLFSLDFYIKMLNQMLLWFTFPLIVLFIAGLFYKYKTTINSLKFSDNSLLNIKRMLNEEKTYIPYLLTLWGFLFILAFPNHSFGDFGHPYWMYYLLPGISIVGAQGLKRVTSESFLRNYKNKMTLAILLMFIIFSFSFTYTYHQNQPQRGFYEIGLFINNHTEKNDLIAVEFTTIAFYADRPFIGIPSSNQPIRIISKYHPKIVEIKKLENDELYVSSLKNLDYELIYEKYNRQVWELNNDSSFSFVSEFDKAFTKFGNDNKLMPSNSTLKYIRISSYDNNNKTMSIYQHPFKSEKTFLVYTNISIPQDAKLIFGVSMDNEFWFPEKGDGVLFEIYISNPKNESDLITIFSKYINPKNNVSDRKWHNFEIPLDGYADKNVNISFVTSSGPRNDTSYDWAYWGEPKIVVKMPNNNSAP